MTDTLIAPPSTATQPARPAPAASDLLYALSLPGVVLDGLDPVARALAAELGAGKPSRATSCLAIAIWSLRSQGRVELRLAKGKTLGFIPKTELLASPSGAGQASGLEGELLAVLAKRAPRDVRDLVREWFGRDDVPDPHHVAEVRVMRHAAQAGTIEVEQVDAGRNRLVGLVLGKTKTVVRPRAATIQASGPTIEAIATAWQGFRQSEPDVARELVDRIRKALDSKTERDDGPDID